MIVHVTSARQASVAVAGLAPRDLIRIIAQDNGDGTFDLDAPDDLAEAVRAAADGFDAGQDAAGLLAAYAEAKHERVRDGGIRVDVGDGSMADVASNASGRGLVNGCVGLADLAAKADAPAPTFPWVNNDGTKLTLTVAQIETIALALGQFVQATYAALGDVIAGIAAGTIKSKTDIDAAAWPTNSGTGS